MRKYKKDRELESHCKLVRKTINGEGWNQWRAERGLKSRDYFSEKDGERYSFDPVKSATTSW